MLGIRPLVGGVSLAEQRVDDKQNLLAELDSLAERLGPGGARNAGPATGGDEQSLVVLIDRSTRSAGLAPYIKRNQPDGTESIRLRFENAPFDGLLEWLSSMSAIGTAWSPSPPISTRRATPDVSTATSCSRAPSRS